MMKLKQRVIAFNQLLKHIYQTETRLSLLLERFGFSADQVQQICLNYAETLIELHLLKLEEYFVEHLAEESLYEVLKQYFGLEGSPPEPLEKIAKTKNVHPDHIFQLKETAIQKCQDKEWLKQWEQKLYQTTMKLWQTSQNETNYYCATPAQNPSQFQSQNNPSSQGYIYILTNDAMPGIIKIGQCKGQPKLIAKDLSQGVGIPVPFQVYYQRYTSLATEAKTLIYAEFAESRVDILKDFFSLQREVAAENCEEFIKVLQDEPDLLMKVYPNWEKQFTLEESQKIAQCYTPETSLITLSFKFGRTPSQVELLLNSLGVIKTTSYPQKLPKFPARLAEQSPVESSYQERLEKIRAKHPNAYEKWTPEADQLLIKEYNIDGNIKRIAKLLGRQPSAIRSRLKKFHVDNV